MSRKNKTVPRNSKQYTHLCSEYIIPASDLIDKASHKAHDLYNRALYDLRQGLFHRQYIKGYNELDSMFKKRYQARESMLYHELSYVQSAQQTLKEVNTIWQAWFKANKAY